MANLSVVFDAMSLSERLALLQSFRENAVECPDEEHCVGCLHCDLAAGYNRIEKEVDALLRRVCDWRHLP